MRAVKIIGLIVIVLVVLAVCGLMFMRMTVLPAAVYPTQAVSLTDMPGEISSLDKLNAYLDNALPATFAHNVPPDMKVGKEVTIELLMDLTLSEEQIKEKITEAGTVFSQENILVTGEVKAELRASEPDAFTIVPPQELIRQINSRETLRWAWQVTPRESGPRTLIIDVYRRVLINNEEKWEPVSTYNPVIRVEVEPTVPAYWAWIGALLVAALVAALLLWRRRAGLERRGMRPGRPATPKAKSPATGCVLISYRRADSADIAGRIYDRLVAEFGPEPVFKDVDSIPLGINFKQHLEQKVGESSVFLALIGDRWLDAADKEGRRRLDDPEDYVRIEIESALERGIPVIPLLVRGAQMPEEDRLPEGLRRLVYMNGIPIRPDPDFHNDMNRLIAAIHKYM